MVSVSFIVSVISLITEIIDNAAEMSTRERGHRGINQRKINNGAFDHPLKSDVRLMVSARVATPFNILAVEIVKR